MKQFNKTLIAAALMVAVVLLRMRQSSVAHWRHKYNEAYLVAYDSAVLMLMPLKAVHTT